MPEVGAFYLGNSRCKFVVWAPLLKQVSVKIVDSEPRIISMQQDGQGYWSVIAEAVQPGACYFYQLNGEINRPDPASRSQPQGVHGPSQVVEQAFHWSDNDWSGFALEDMILYEVHVGTFTPQGTFEAIISRLPRLKELGITAVEIMPVAQVPGEKDGKSEENYRNWGYDGAYPYAVQNSYGGVQGLKQLVNACHQQGIAVVLDVVYNHLGPEGNYLGEFAPYFTSKFRPVWGEAINFDDAYCDGVRNYFLRNALYWLETFHIDALRLDAIQGIYDLSAKHFLEELAEKVADSQQGGRKRYLMAESDLNDVRVLRPQSMGGYGVDTQWCDDFHHALHTLITGEKNGYYQDFGRVEDLAKSLREGFIYSGQYSLDRHRCHGNSSIAEPAQQFLVCSQNHDQIGNRILGERLTQLTSFEGLKLAASAVLLSPYIPLLFMGEEYGEPAPFLYFISHSDRELVAAIQQSKDKEFKQVGYEGKSLDSHSPEIFERCKLNWKLQHEGKHQVLWQFYQLLIQLRRSHPALKKLDKQSLEVKVNEADRLLVMRRWSDQEQVLAVMNFSDRPVELNGEIPDGSWQKILDTADRKWHGSGATLPEKLLADQPLMAPAKSFTLYQT
ncbi:malto-oligosyltrehalose trehalohydrolase [Phormidium sp. CLA17]|uniref:malto-oligosyltrehalose trehalohydrolase n=1 Tax=Leptolyngbya sp. Cla-17 TaxID=2803751 RepID=UPI001492EE0A|nr:malto-oligosyltrehalose trehalohydrolase [Leptolyngbya sp. Cla-17]MBM0742887.1 malto-oligosyltrehalose trehalohydrolase [Leptolyngbya sp. Cla-17]